MKLGKEHLLYEDLARGVRATMEFDPSGATIYRTHQDVAPIIEHNKRLRNEQAATGRPNTQRHVQHVASIPIGIHQLWTDVLGDPNSGDPDVQKKWKDRLNDPEWRHIRTGGGHI